MKRSLARNAIVLGLLAAVGPFAIDMYLPALPSIAADFKASDAAVQGSLIAFFLAVAFGQIVYGPVSDSLGRRAPLYFGMVLYSLGAIGCSMASSIEWLIAARFVQGVGACAGMAIPRAIVRDLYTGPDAARLMSLIMLVFSAAPILAPLFGSMVIALANWRVIFDAVALVGVLGVAITFFVLDETRPPEKRVPMDIASVARGYLELFRDRAFVGIVLVGGFAMASLFSFLAGSSFVYIDHFGLTPTQFSFAFAINAISFIGSAQSTSLLARRFGLKRVVRGSVTLFLLATGILFGATLAGVDNVYALIAMLLVSFGVMGPVGPATAVLALEQHGSRAGAASALLGTLQLIIGMTVVAITGAVSNGTVLPLASAIFGCAGCAFLINLAALGSRDPAPELAE
jgi:DHA1 family bicyclomycin/chloramphenicol resistance-like MFS transporter